MGGSLARALSVNGHYRPVPGDFDGDGDTDIIWYTPGTSPDFLWWAADGSFSSALPPQVNGCVPAGAGGLRR